MPVKVIEAVDPMESELQKHRCDLPDIISDLVYDGDTLLGRRFSPPLGSIATCTDCSSWWVAKRDPDFTYLGAWFKLPERKRRRLLKRQERPNA